MDWIVVRMKSTIVDKKSKAKSVLKLSKKLFFKGTADSKSCFILFYIVALQINSRNCVFWAFCYLKIWQRLDLSKHVQCKLRKPRLLERVHLRVRLSLCIRHFYRIMMKVNALGTR
jgi:hypothetical protein